MAVQIQERQMTLFGEAVITPQERAEIDRSMDRLAFAMCKPLIVYPGGWHDTIPDHLKTTWKVESLVQARNGEEMGTDVEALMYLYTAALTTPLDDDWSQIYFYLVTKYMKDRVPEDISVRELDRYRQGLLQDLKRHIWKKQAKHWVQDKKRETQG